MEGHIAINWAPGAPMHCPDFEQKVAKGTKSLMLARTQFPISAVFAKKGHRDLKAEPFL
jgi:hypothetical protein